MFVWIAADADAQLGALRGRADEISRTLGIENAALTLPFHVSLKISFRVSDDVFDKVTADAVDFLKSKPSFRVKTGNVEKMGNVVWLSCVKSDVLSSLHDGLDELFLSKYGVERHEFDKCFLFHTSLVVCDYEDKLTRAYEMLKNEPAPKEITVSRFIVGCSETGEAGSYKVLKYVDAK